MKKICFFLLICFSFLGAKVQAKPEIQQIQTTDKPVLVLYYSPTCPYSVKVLNFLKTIHKTLPMKDVSANREYKEELKKLGGKSQVPCLIIDGKPMYESDVIINWLGENRGYLDNN